MTDAKSGGPSSPLSLQAILDMMSAQGSEAGKRSLKLRLADALADFIGAILLITPVLSRIEDLLNDRPYTCNDV